MVKRFVIPFATSGDKTVTPDATDPGGAISYSQGWPVAYQLPDTDPAYRPIGRQEMNGVLFDVTGALAELQTFGYPKWVPVAGLVQPYEINATLRHNNLVWSSSIANNSDEPGVGAGATSWRNTGVIAAASETVSGILEIATQAETNAGTDDLRAITALKLASRTGNYPGSTHRNLKVSTTGTSAAITVTADQLSLGDASGNARTISAVALSVSAAVSGVNGLDTGVKAPSTWYYLFAILNKTSGVVGGLLSLNPTGPLLPVGFTHWMRVGAVYTDATGNAYPLPIVQYGAEVEYNPAAGTNLTTSPIIASGVQGSVGVTGVAVSGTALRVPATATEIKVGISSLSTASTAQISPVAAMGISSGSLAVTLGNSGSGYSISIRQNILLRTLNLYYAANSANCAVATNGWRDSI